MGPTWGPPGSCRPQMGPMLTPWTLLSGSSSLLIWDVFCEFKPYTSYNAVIDVWYSVTWYIGGGHIKNRTLQWRHNGRDGVSNHQPHDCLLNCLFRHRAKKTLKLRVTSLYAGNSPVTGEHPAQMASNAENVSIWWRHHGCAWPLPAPMSICCFEQPKRVN